MTIESKFKSLLDCHLFLLLKIMTVELYLHKATTAAAAAAAAVQTPEMR